MKGGSKTVIVCRLHDSIHREAYRLHKGTTQPNIEFVKIEAYKVNIQKPKAFLYTNSEISKTEIMKKNPSYYSNKESKVPRNKFNQRGKRPVFGKLQNTEERN